MIRLYISKLTGDGLTPETAYSPAWREVIGNDILQISQTLEMERYFFWLGQLDTSEAQHTLLLADPRIRYISQTLMATLLVDLTTPQRNAILEVYTWLGFPVNIWNINNTKVADVIFYIMGRAAWHPIAQAADVY